MANDQADGPQPGAGNNPAAGAAAGEQRKSDKAQAPPGSKTGTDTRESGKSGASTGGPGGPDSGSDAMPGRSNAL